MEQYGGGPLHLQRSCVWSATDEFGANFFQETIQRRDELFEEPGDAVLLSDAVCSEHHDCLCCRG